MNTQRFIAALLVVSAAAGALAAPALHKPMAAGPLPLVYPDARDAALFYYPPPAIELATERDGSPDFRFLQVIYAGTETTGDPGRFIARSLIAFRVRMQQPDPQKLREAREALPPNSRLVPLPIRRITSNLVWTPVESEPPARIGAGRFEESPGSAAAAEGSWWTERMVTLAPEPLSSQLLWEAFRRGRVLLSFAYALDAEGIVSDESQELATRTLGGSTIPIDADAGRWPSHFRRVDINQGVPPGYALLGVRCYDFASAEAGEAAAPTRPPVAIKRVEIRAQAVGGTSVTRTVTFRAGSPDLVAATVRFPVAVRLDRPFSYRVSVVRADGTSITSAWREGASWWRELDVTSAGGES